MSGHSGRAHSKFSASGSERWLNCAASVALEEQSPPSPDNVWSLEGTKGHEVLEWIFKVFMLDVLFPFRAALAKSAVVMVKHAMTMVHLVMSIKGKLADPILLIEERVYNDDIHDEMFGTVDAAIVEIFGELHVFDYKYGQSPVDPTRNTQMIQYALGLAAKYNWQFTKVVLHICQPRAGGNRSWEMTIDELRAYKELWLKGVARVEAGKSKPYPGSWCHWCRAKAICPAKIVAREEKGTNLFASKPLPERITNGKDEKESAIKKGQSESAGQGQKTKKVRLEKIEAEEKDFF